MNLTIARALISAQFRRTLPILVCSMGIIGVFCAWAYILLQLRPNANAGDAAGVTMAGIVLAYILGVFMLLYCQSDASDLRLNMPAYLLRLPVRTTGLVALHMGYNLLFIAVLAIISSVLFHALFSGTYAEAPFWVPLYIAVTVLACLQALAWCIGGTGMAVALTAFVLYILVNWLTFQFRDSMPDVLPYLNLVTLSVVGFAFVAACVGVALHRRGALDFGELLGRILPALRGRRASDQRPFASADQAMRWFDWRRQGRMLPFIAIPLSILTSTVAVARIGVSNVGEYPLRTLMAAYGETVVLYFYISLVFSAMFLGALFFFQNFRLQTGPQRAFLFIRPVTTKALASARVAGALRSVLVSMVPLAIAGAVAIVLAAWSTVAGGLSGFVDQHMGIGGTVIALLSLIGIFAMVWCVQWFGAMVALFALWLVSTIFVEVLDVFYPVNRVSYALWLTGAIAIAGCAYLFYKAHQLGLLDRKSVRIGLIAWPLLAAGFLTRLIWGHLIDGQPYDFTYLSQTVFVAAALPIAPFATVPLIMHWARHR